MILLSMQQAEEPRAAPVFVEPAQKLSSFLLGIWAVWVIL